MPTLEPEDDLRITRLEHAARKARENIGAIWLFIALLGFMAVVGVFWR